MSAEVAEEDVSQKAKKVKQKQDGTLAQEELALFAGTTEQTCKMEVSGNDEGLIDAPVADRGEKEVSGLNFASATETCDRYRSQATDEDIAKNSTLSSLLLDSSKAATLDASRPVSNPQDHSQTSKTTSTRKSSIECDKSCSGISVSVVPDAERCLLRTQSSGPSSVANDVESSNLKNNPSCKQRLGTAVVLVEKLTTLGDQITLRCSKSSRSPKAPSEIENCNDIRKPLELLDSLEGKKSPNVAQNPVKCDACPPKLSTSSKKHRSHSSPRTYSEDSKKRRHPGDESKVESLSKKHKTSESSSKIRDHSSSSDSSTPQPANHHKPSASSSSKPSQIDSNEKPEKGKVLESKCDIDNKPTQIGTSKKSRVSRVSSDYPNSKSRRSTFSSKLSQTKSENPKERSKDSNGSSSRQLKNDVSCGSNCESNEKNSTSNIDPPDIPPENTVNSETAHKSSKISELPNDEGLDPELELARIWLDATKIPIQKKSASPGTGDYLKRSLLKLEKEKENAAKNPLAEAPKPASAFRRKNKPPSQPEASVLTPATSTDVSEINASIPIDEKLFADLENEPVPLIAAIEKVFEPPRKMRRTAPIEKDDRQQLFQENDLMDFDDYSDLDSLDSPTAIPDTASVDSPTVHTDEEAKDGVEESNPVASSGATLKISYTMPNSEGFETLKTIAIPLGPHETGSLRTNEGNLEKEEGETLEPTVALIVADKVDDPDKQEAQLEDRTEVEAVARTARERSSATGMKPTSVPPLLSPTPDLLISIVDPPYLQNQDQPIEQMYEEMVNVMRVFRYRRDLLEQNPGDYQLNASLDAICTHIKVKFGRLKLKAKVESDEDMIELIVKFVTDLKGPVAEEINWALKKTQVDVEPIPAPDDVLPIVEIGGVKSANDGAKPRAKKRWKLEVKNWSPESSKEDIMTQNGSSLSSVGASSPLRSGSLESVPQTPHSPLPQSPLKNISNLLTSNPLPANPILPQPLQSKELSSSELQPNSQVPQQLSLRDSSSHNSYAVRQLPPRIDKCQLQLHHQIPEPSMHHPIQQKFQPYPQNPLIRPPFIGSQLPVPPEDLQLPPDYEICISGKCKHPNCGRLLAFQRKFPGQKLPVPPVNLQLPPDYEICISGNCKHPNCERRLAFQRQFPGKQLPAPPVNLQLPADYETCISGNCKHHNCERRIAFQRHMANIQQKQSRDPRSRGAYAQPPVAPVSGTSSGLQHPRIQSQHTSQNDWRQPEVVVPENMRERSIGDAPQIPHGYSHKVRQSQNRLSTPDLVQLHVPRNQLCQSDLSGIPPLLSQNLRNGTFGADSSRLTSSIPALPQQVGSASSGERKSSEVRPDDIAVVPLNLNSEYSIGNYRNTPEESHGTIRESPLKFETSRDLRSHDSKLMDQISNHPMGSDQIECSGNSRDLKLDQTSACHPELVKDHRDRWKEEMDMKLETVEDITEDSTETKPNICVACGQGVVVRNCRYCHETLFCSRFCENRSVHFNECPQKPLVLDIDDD